MGCGCQVDGTLIISPAGVSPVYTKPGRRGGPSALVSLEILEFSASVSLAVYVQHKNRNDTAWATLATFSESMGSAGVYSEDMSGFKQQMRTVITFATGAAKGDIARVANIFYAWRPV